MDYAEQNALRTRLEMVANLRSSPGWDLFAEATTKYRDGLLTRLVAAQTPREERGELAAEIRATDRALGWPLSELKRLTDQLERSRHA